MGVLLVLYALAGGLFTPLKTGITGVNKVQIQSGIQDVFTVDVYNPGESFKPDQVVLKNSTHQFVADSFQYNPDGLLTVFTKAVYGTKTESGLFNLYVHANGKWMGLPSALSVVWNSADTVASAAAVSNKDLLANADNPDEMKGFPNRSILNESIRNLLYHVPMWFSMIFVMAFAAWQSVKFLRTGNLDADIRTESLVVTGLLAGVLGCVTGSFWASVTWQSWWPRDPKLNGVAIGMLMYLAYLLLRSGIRDDYQKARASAVYNLFVFPVFVALIWVMPKISGDSLHPGAGGTVGFNQYDLDNTLRMYFYPAVAGWIMIFSWIASLLYRTNKLELTQSDNNQS